MSFPEQASSAGPGGRLGCESQLSSLGSSGWTGQLAIHAGGGFCGTWIFLFLVIAEAEAAAEDFDADDEPFLSALLFFLRGGMVVI